MAEVHGNRTPVGNVEEISICDHCGAECGADVARTVIIDADLGVVVEAWRSLPEPIKAGILAMIRTLK